MAIYRNRPITNVSYVGAVLGNIPMTQRVRDDFGYPDYIPYTARGRWDLDSNRIYFDCGVVFDIYTRTVEN